MPDTTPCSSALELQDYYKGLLPLPDRERVRAHVRECRECAGRLAALQRDQQTFAETGTGGNSRVDATNASAASFLLPPEGPDELGWLAHYRVHRILGQGGMGAVFDAFDTRLRRHVALKVMLPSLAADLTYRQRFVREAQAMAAVTHDHIVTVFQVDVAEGKDGQNVPYLAMQLLQGESLESRILRQGRLNAGETVRIGRQIAEGLAAAHSHGLIHRDIKPGNIYLEKPRDRVKILDFGLARLSEGKSNLSQTGQFIGTPYYMSPEQARGDTIDSRSDLFSLGCVLYVMLGGKLPFDGSHAMAVLTALAVQEPESLARIAPETPGPLVELVHRLLSKNVNDRPASAQVVAEMLEVMERGATIATPGGSGSGAIPDTLGQLTVPQAPSNPRMNTPGPSPVGTVLTPPPGAAGSPPATVAPMPPVNRSPWVALTGLAVVAIAALVGIGFLLRSRGEPDAGTIAAPSGEPILVGILHSQSGTMRESETPVLDMTRLALEELNERGGLLGRPVKIITRDGASEESIFAREADRLIHQDKVSVLFGCWTSASRKAVKDVVEEHDHLLFYPLQYEGLEQSSNIVYTGATPDQQVFPAIDWCLKKGFKKFYLVGSDYVYPRAVNAIVRDRLAAIGAEVVGEDYLPLGSTVVDPIVSRIRQSPADVVLNTINGDSNLPFFRELREKGVSPQRTPVISFSLDESSLKNFNPRHVAGHYAAWSYFQTIPGPVNERFVSRYRAAYGEYKTLTDPMQSAWLGVQFWAKAVKEAGSERPKAVRRAIPGQEVDAPEGPRVHVDPVTQHTWKYFRLARVTDKAEFEIVVTSDVLDSPEPFPTSRTRKAWEQFLQDLYKGWGNRWSSTGE